MKSVLCAVGVALYAVAMAKLNQEAVMVGWLAGLVLAAGLLRSRE